MLLLAFLLRAHRESLVLAGCRDEAGVLWGPRSLLVLHLPLVEVLDLALGAREVAAAITVLDDGLNVLLKIGVQDL